MTNDSYKCTNNDVYLICSTNDFVSVLKCLSFFTIAFNSYAVSYIMLMLMHLHVSFLILSTFVFDEEQQGFRARFYFIFLLIEGDFSD